MRAVAAILIAVATAFPACQTMSPASPVPAATRLGLPAAVALPAWAGVLADPLPATTRNLLALDGLHREHNPLGNELAARLRLTVARALGCDPVAAAAESDLRRAATAGPAADPGPDAETVAVEFARQLTEAGHAIPEAQFAALLAQFGAERATAIVHSIAYANFLCRIVFGLGVHDATPIVPAALLAAAGTAARPSTRRLPVAAPAGSGGSPVVDLPAWGERRWADLLAAKDGQRQRPLRMPLPEDERLQGLTERERRQSELVVWSRVGYGYQPGLTRAWFACLYAFQAEANLDRVFANSVFWVVTRTNDCFY
ncbi:MAG: hypothetical protein KF830_01235 [Planctomycetes bacterium]|nr:hypothetical protein [Planctomycetota bacterium]